MAVNGLPMQRVLRRGPLPGSTEVFGASDRALYPEIERIMGEGRSLRAAARELVSAGKVDGTCGPRGRWERLMARYRRERLWATAQRVG